MMIQMFYQNDLVESLNYVQSFTLFKDGEKETIKSNENFNNILNKFREIFYYSNLLPALGVSLHEEIIKELNTGEWIQINYEKEITINDLPFNSLLIKIESACGANLIRLYNNQYSGRCLYVNFEHEINLKNLIYN